MSTPEERLEQLHRSVLQNKGEASELNEDLATLESHLELMVESVQGNTEIIRQLVSEVLQELNECEQEMIQNLHVIEEKSQSLMQLSSRQIDALNRSFAEVTAELGHLNHSFNITSNQTFESQGNLQAQAIDFNQNHGEWLSLTEQSFNDFKQAISKDLSDHFDHTVELHEESTKDFMESQRKVHRKTIQSASRKFQKESLEDRESFEKESSTNQTKFVNELTLQSQKTTQHQNQLIDVGLDDFTQIASDVKNLIDSVTNLSRVGAQATNTVIEGMDALNLGFNVTVGTLENIRDILDEISL